MSRLFSALEDKTRWYIFFTFDYTARTV